MSIGVSAVLAKYVALVTVRSPADQELTNLSPAISISENSKPVESKDTIALFEVPDIPDIEPLAPEDMLTALLTPDINSKLTIEAVPPCRLTPVPVEENVASETDKFPEELMPADIS